MASDNLNLACRDHRPGPVDAAIDGEARERLRQALANLTDCEAVAVSLYFGLSEPRPRSIITVARRLKVKREFAAFLLESAMSKLRRAVDGEA